VLEFAVGTGRIALPLRAAGVRVDGIELSEQCLSNKTPGCRSRFAASARPTPSTIMGD
jgi:hypothetical protein